MRAARFCSFRVKFVGETITAASPNSAAIVKLWLYQTIKDAQKDV